MNKDDIISGIISADDLIDELLEPIKDYTDTIGDLATPIKGFISIYNLRKKIQFNTFLKGYSKSISSKNLNNKDRLKMKKYLSNEKNIVYISEIVESALSSISIKASSILGSFAGKVLIKGEPLDDIEYILVSSIKGLTDNDLELFVALCQFTEHTDSLPKRQVIGEAYEYRIYDIFEEFDLDLIPFERDEMEFVIEKLKNRGILSYSVGGIGLYGNNRGAFVFTKYSKRLMEILSHTDDI